MGLFTQNGKKNGAFEAPFIVSEILIRLGEISVFSELRWHFFSHNSHSFTGEWSKIFSE